MADSIMPVGDLAKHVGEEIGASSWTTLDQARIDEFAHWFLTLSLLAPTGFEVLLARIAPKSVVNYGLEKVRFVAPVRSGKRVRNRIKIAAVEPKGGGRDLVTTENTMEIEGETKPALIASVLAMFME